MISESQMEEPFVNWLRQTRRVRYDSRILRQFSWLNRRIDIVTMTISGIVASYELKLHNNTVAIEQAAKNAHAFQRSYIVTMTKPSLRNRQLAATHGIGIIHMTDDRIMVLANAPWLRQPPNVLSRLRHQIRQKAPISNV